MAKINVSYDTETEEITVNVGGKSIDNVHSVSFMKMKDYEGEEHSYFSVMTETKNDGVSECTMYSSAQEKGSVPSIKVKGMFETGKLANSIGQTIAKLFKRSK